MRATGAMPIARNTIISSYTEFAFGEREPTTEITKNNSPRSTIMDSSEDTSDKVESNINVSGNNNSRPSASEQKNISTSSNKVGKDDNQTTGDISSTLSSGSYPQVVPPHGTPQQSAYYGYTNSQVTPESPSTSASDNARTAAYDGALLFQQQQQQQHQQQASFHSNSPFSTTTAPVANHQYAGSSTFQQPPNSPTQSMSGIPPASPLFPRTSGIVFMTSPRGGDSTGNPAMSPVPSGYVPSSGMYIPGNSYFSMTGRPTGSFNPNSNIGVANGNSTNDKYSTWNENLNFSYPLSPGQGIPYVPGIPQRSDRSSSFDETVNYPPSGSDSVQQVPTSAYGAGPGGGPPQGWSYAGPSLDVMSQGRSSVTYSGQHHSGPQYRHPSQQYGGNPYGGSFGFPTTSSPGPPIQTTSANKGPDGANLFVFHIPNHFSNLDMYQLFCHYGNLLSVRIMVEKDTGRSRGFGFVSYDNPDAAALAIKELSGFAIGNKRLKVQHKQSRPMDQQQPERHLGGHGNHNSSQYYDGRVTSGHGGQGAYSGSGGTNNLPPSGPMTVSSTGWYNNNNDRNQQSAATAGGNPHHVVVVVGDDPNSPNRTAAAAVSNKSGGADAGATTSETIIPRRDDQQNQSNGDDPLSNMEPLRQTLPDIGISSEN